MSSAHSLTARVDRAGLRVLLDSGLCVATHPQPGPLFIDEANDWLEAHGFRVEGSWIAGFTGWTVGPPMHVRSDYSHATVSVRLVPNGQDGSCGQPQAPHVAACYCDRPAGHDDHLHACWCGGLWRRTPGSLQVLVAQRGVLSRRLRPDLT